MMSAPAPGPFRRRLNAVWPWVAAVASGAMLALCLPPWDLGGLVWFALTPLVCVSVWPEDAGAPRRRRVFLPGYLAGLIFFTTTFHWLGALGQLFEAPALFGIPPLLGAYLALYPAAWSWFFARVLAPSAESRRFGRSWHNLGLGVLGASAWTALEWMRGWFLGGFSWNGLGVALHRDLPMIQIAEFTGTLGLTWLVAFVNVMIVIVVRRILGELGPGFLKRVRWEFTVSMVIVVLVFSYGIRQLLRAPGAVTANLQIAVIQPNIPQEQKFDRAADAKSQKTLERLTLMAAALEPDLFVWPEASTARGIFSDPGHAASLMALRRRVSKPILVGTIEDTLVEGKPRTFNSAMLIPPGAKPLAEQPPTYRKIHLVPFGEYLPLRPLLGWLVGGLVPGDIDAGKEFTVFQHGTLAEFAALICFEDTDGPLTRRFVANGADLLVNITNDGWFLRTIGMEQHLANAVLRAVENRRSLVRCGNTGVTALVRPNGSVERWLEPHREGFAVKAVEVREAPLTFYTRNGDWVAWLSAALTLGALVRLRRP